VGLRSSVSQSLDRVVGPERTARLRGAEARARARLIDALDIEGTRKPAPQKPAHKRAKPGPAAKAPRKPTRAERIEAFARDGREGISHRSDNDPAWVSSDPFADFPPATSTRHALLGGLHDQMRPRTYFEIGVDRGQSMTQSRTRSIGVDPAFSITEPIHCDVRIFRETSDDFFALPDAFEHFGGTPVDLAFIDGMHLAEFALRDFMNIEKHMSRAGVVVLDDMLPRNDLEAFRIRRTSAWAGDVYKVHAILERYRPDLTIIPVNTAPTGSYVILGLDPDSTVLDDNYAEIEPQLTGADPQQVPQEWLERRTAVDAKRLLDLDIWSQLATLRDPEPERDALAELWAAARAVPPAAG
jgi:hypothetical protein